MSRISFALVFTLTALALPPSAAAAPQVGHDHGLGERDPELSGTWMANGEAEPQPLLGAPMPERARTAWETFQDRGSGGWRAMWSGDTGVPALTYGGSIEVPGSVKDPAIAEAAARDLLARHIGLFAPGAAPSDFVLVANHLNHAEDYRSVGFEQRHQGMRVLTGQFNVRFKNDRIFGVGSEALPYVAIEPLDAVVTGADAIAQAEQWLRSTRGLSGGRVGEVEGPYIKALRSGARITYRPVLRVTVDFVPEVFETWEVDLDARTGAPVARRQTLHFGAGTFEFRTPDRWPQNGRVSTPVKDITLDGVTDAGANVTVTTDVSGQLTWTGSTIELSNPTQSGIDLGDGPVRSGVSGPLVRVADAGRAATNFSATLMDGGTTVVEDTDEFDDATLNTYLATHVARDRVLELSPGLGWLAGRQQLAFTNLNGVCNALSNGAFIFMFRAGRGCQNTGLIDDVVFHEFGHTVHAQSLIAGVGQFVTDHSEGLSDYFAATITGDASMARGFFFTNAPLRQIDPARPDTFSQTSGDPVQHTRGLTYAGAAWDTRTNLIAKLGPEAGLDAADTLWFEVTRRASGIPTTFIETLLADDDDGDLGNGTPNFCEVFDAFDAHELVFDESFGTSVGAVRRDGNAVSLPVSSGVSCNPISDVSLVYSVSGGEPQTLTPTLDENGYSATLPQDDLRFGDVVSYHFELTLEEGRTERRPLEEGSAYIVGEETEIACNSFINDPFSRGYESALLRGNPDAPGANDWQWGSPAARPGSGDPELGFESPRAVGNDIGLRIGNNFFNGRYQANVENLLRAPARSVGGLDRVFVRYRRWLTVEDAAFDQASILVNDQVAWQNASAGPEGGDDHVDTEWVEHLVEVTDLVDGGETAQVEFRLRSDGGREFGGWTIDDLCVVGLPSPQCGNDVLEVGEECEGGPDCSDTCTVIVVECGNGRVEEGEACDDGNAIDGDGCESTCQPTPAMCGNGILDEGEVCDDGNRVDGDGCESTCVETPAAPVCGNGVVEEGEACDDGNLVDGDGCESACVETPSTDPSPDPGGLAGGLNASEGGCVCATPHSGANLLSALMLGLGAAFFIRRRRA